jgi:hypothetical protein
MDAVLGYEPFYMLSGWNTYILVFGGDGLLQCFGWNSYGLFLALPSVFLLPQVVPACRSVVVVFLIAFRATAAYFLTVIRVSFTDFDWRPFFIAAVESLRYWSVDINVFVRVFA